MKDVMEEVIGNTTYDPITCNALVTTVANRIKDSAKIYHWTHTTIQIPMFQNIPSHFSL
jgi:hypothetical protein